MENKIETPVDIEGIVRLYSKNIYNLAYRITGDRHDAEDAMQNTFLQIYKNLNKFRNESKLFTWIYRITLNESLKIKKKVVLDKKHFESVDTDIEKFKNNIPLEIKQLQTDPEKEFIYNALLQEIKNGCHHFMLFRITEEQRIVFIFRIFLHFSFREISAILDLSVNIIKSRFNRAKANLTKHVKGRCQWYNNKSSCTCEKCIGFALQVTPELLHKVREAANNPEYHKMAATYINQIDDIEAIYKKLPNLEYKTSPLRKIK